MFVGNNSGRLNSKDRTRKFLQSTEKRVAHSSREEMDFCIGILLMSLRISLECPLRDGCGFAQICGSSWVLMGPDISWYILFPLGCEIEGYRNPHTVQQLMPMLAHLFFLQKDILGSYRWTMSILGSCASLGRWFSMWCVALVTRGSSIWRSKTPPILAIGGRILSQHPEPCRIWNAVLNIFNMLNTKHHHIHGQIFFRSEFCGAALWQDPVNIDPVKEPGNSAEWIVSWKQSQVNGDLAIKHRELTIKTIGMMG